MRFLDTVARFTVLALLGSTIVFCGEDEGGGGSSEDAAGVLNGSVSGDSTLNDPEEDPSITVTTDAPPGHTEATAGGQLNVALTFDTPNANVIGAGVRFGDSGPIHVVNAPTDGQTSGTINVAIDIPSSICDNLSDICHDIKCYEFAVTSEGKVSRANINDVALKCGNCDEPSCKELLDNCNISSGCDQLCNQICPTGGCPSICELECVAICQCTEDLTGQAGVTGSCCSAGGLSPTPDGTDCACPQ